MYVAVVVPPAPIELLVTVCCCGTVRLASVAFSVVRSLPREFFWAASWLSRAAIPFSVRCVCCSAAASWLASASSCCVWAFWLPDSSISSDPCCSTAEGSPEVSTPATDVAPESSNAAAAVCATLACAVRNWALA